MQVYIVVARQWCDYEYDTEEVCSLFKTKESAEAYVASNPKNFDLSYRAYMGKEYLIREFQILD